MSQMTPEAFVDYAADRLTCSSPTDRRDRALAELLKYAAATWQHQDEFMREDLTAVARHTLIALDTPPTN
ncbi:hypothetical protein ACFVU3_07985 [Streptomyces sp. NPDC058052]|uniref:hypothetical protein n=1 Tax=Streptomyces sp. NPDC058052 TaxID=3346316 RepID=UPI0036E045FB